MKEAKSGAFVALTLCTSIVLFDIIWYSNLKNHLNSQTCHQRSLFHLVREEWFPIDKVYSRSKKTNKQHPTSYGKSPTKLCFSLRNHLLIILYIKNKNTLMINHGYNILAKIQLLCCSLYLKVEKLKYLVNTHFHSGNYY